jgi:hypothetical protein
MTTGRFTIGSTGDEHKGSSQCLRRQRSIELVRDHFLSTTPTVLPLKTLNRCIDSLPLIFLT